jgi:hypothetical protein
MLTIKYLATGLLIPYANNSRTHTAQQIRQVSASIQEFGFTNPVLIDEDNGIIAGHGRVLAAELIGLEKVPTITLKGLSEAQRRAYVIADNQIALNAGWNKDNLRLEIMDLKKLDFNIKVIGFEISEIKSLFDEDKYSEKVEAPIYEPSEKKPDFNELYDSDKCFRLIKNIEESNISDNDKFFLTMAAYRHVSFNFENIANYYAHANKRIQGLMEESALVIIDYNKAIENGYVTFSQRISEQYLLDHPHEE